MGASKVVKRLPLRQRLSQVDIILVGQQLIKHPVVGSMGSLRFPIVLWAFRFDIDTTNDQVLYMPMELGLQRVL